MVHRQAGQAGGAGRAEGPNSRSQHGRELLGARRVEARAADCGGGEGPKPETALGTVGAECSCSYPGLNGAIHVPSWLWATVWQSGRTAVGTGWGGLLRCR